MDARGMSVPGLGRRGLLTLGSATALTISCPPFTQFFNRHTMRDPFGVLAALRATFVI